MGFEYVCRRTGQPISVSPDLEMDALYHDAHAYYRPCPPSQTTVEKASGNLPDALLAGTTTAAAIAAEAQIDAQASAAASTSSII